MVENTFCRLVMASLHISGVNVSANVRERQWVSGRVTCDADK